MPIVFTKHFLVLKDIIGNEKKKKTFYKIA